MLLIRTVAQELLQLRPANRRIVKRYLSSEGPKKLHLGSGNPIVNEWLNTDLFSRRGVTYVNVARGFPLPDGAFDYIYSEHMIEHLTYAGGMNMLRESLSVLTPRGKLRLVTPDFAFLKTLHEPEKTDLQKTYLVWSHESWLGSVSGEHPEMLVINNFFRAWDHKFIYDETTLTEGAQNGRVHAYPEMCPQPQRGPVFCGLGKRKENADGILNLELMVLEVRSPKVRTWSIVTRSPGRGQTDVPVVIRVHGKTSTRLTG